MRRRSKLTAKKQVTVIPFSDCPAKTQLSNNGNVLLGQTVVEHCHIVGEVAKELISRFPYNISSSLFPSGSPLVASTHDVGKVSPTFVEKIRRACSQCSVLTEISIDPNLEREWGGHAGVSQLTALHLNTPRYIPEILGQHHGFSPSHMLASKRASDEVFGGDGWQKERERLVCELKKRLSMDWPEVKNEAQARLLAGLTTVADWVGSGKYFEDPSIPWKKNITRALDSAGMIPPTYKQGMSFTDIFGFSPRVAQQQLLDVVTGPGVYVLEAPMGIGKTEAALYCAYQLLRTHQASGIYFALPTQLTSNKIFERFSTFLNGDTNAHRQGILADDCLHRSLLLHSKAWLLNTDMGEECRPGGEWFNQAKRGLLAPFAVGTLDQALMAAMNVKHGFVRAFGLAGKVVILDEVHTYDAYTSTLLDALVKLLRELHCTVIILSATLNRERRRQLLGYNALRDDYPLITAIPNGQAAQELHVAVSENESYDVAVRLVGKCKLAIEEALYRAEQGQQVLWIENTVKEAQQRYLDFAARASELGVACGLLHSRFTPEHRQEKEARWVSIYGKEGWADRNKQGRILVGTQVLEQSLDIDADFLVTRFAPTDMVLQRIGRLWRHSDTPRATSAQCECWLIAPDLAPAISSPEAAFGSSAFVYSPYVLCRSLEVWESLTKLTLPTQIRDLIEQTYLSRPEHQEMARWLYELDNGTRHNKGRVALSQLARIALSECGKTLPESKAQTRYSETNSLDVLLLSGFKLLSEQRASQLTLLNGEQILLPWARHALSTSEWKAVTVQLMNQIVSVPVQDAPRATPLKALRELGLHNCFYLGDASENEAVIRMSVINNKGELSGLNKEPLHNETLEYRLDIGYKLTKK